MLTSQSVTRKMGSSKPCHLKSGSKRGMCNLQGVGRIDLLVGLRRRFPVVFVVQEKGSSGNSEHPALEVDNQGQQED